MFSHVLVAYQAALLDFATKSSYTFQAALKILDEKPQYSFTILKDLTQVPVVHENPAGDDSGSGETKGIASLDFDQMLFFKVRITNSGISRGHMCTHTYHILFHVSICVYRKIFKMTLKHQTVHPIRKVTKLLHKPNPKASTLNQVNRKQLSAIQQFSICWTYQRLSQPKRIVFWIFLVMQQMDADQIMQPHNHLHRIY